MGSWESLRFDFVVYYGYSNAFSSGACVIITSEGWKITAKSNPRLTQLIIFWYLMVHD